QKLAEGRAGDFRLRECLAVDVHEQRRRAPLGPDLDAVAVHLIGRGPAAADQLQAPGAAARAKDIARTRLDRRGALEASQIHPVTTVATLNGDVVDGVAPHGGPDGVVSRAQAHADPVNAMDVGMFLEMPAARIDGHQRGGVAVIRLDLKEDVGVTRYWGDEETVPPGRSKHRVIAAPG